MSDNKETNGNIDAFIPFPDEPIPPSSSLLKQLEEAKKRENTEQRSGNEQLTSSSTSSSSVTNTGSAASKIESNTTKTTTPPNRINPEAVERDFRQKVLKNFEDALKEEVMNDPEFGWESFCSLKQQMEENKKLKEENEVLKTASTELAAEKETSSVLRTTVIILIIVAAVLAIIAYSCSKSKTETTQELTDLQWKYGILYDEYSFYHDYAVIVSKNGKYYHSYGCEKLGTPDRFYIFNIDNAKAQGLKKCKTCQD